MATDDMKAKVLKLLNLSRDRGASEAEAATAMSMATKLMILHGIKESELQQSQVIAGRSENTELERDWQEIIAQAAGELFGCMTLLSKSLSTGQPVFYYVGRPENHDAAKQTFNFLLDQVERLYKAGLPRGMSQRDRANFRRTFKYSCAARIYHRAKELVDEMKRGEHSADISGGTALVVQGYFDKLADEVDEFLKKSGMNIRFKKSKPRSFGLGSAAGHQAGNSVNIRSALR
jgi:hypothetical protein